MESKGNQGMAGQPVVQIEQVNKRFGDTHSGTLALQDISLTIEQGEFVSIVGPSGCGKSTLLRIVADLIAPTNGAVQVMGKTPHQARLDRDYGFVFQAPTLLEWRTVLKNVELPLEVMHGAKAEWRTRALPNPQKFQIHPLARTLVQRAKGFIHQ